MYSLEIADVCTIYIGQDERVNLKRGYFRAQQVNWL